MISFARSTLKKAKEFNELLTELEKTVPLHIIRTYLATGNMLQKIDDATLKQIEHLRTLRQDGISGEMIYANAQAESNGLTLTDEIKSGQSLVPGFSQSVLDKIPSLQVYNYFMLFTEKELADYLEQIKNHSNPDDKPKETNQTDTHTDR